MFYYQLIFSACFSHFYFCIETKHYAFFFLGDHLYELMKKYKSLDILP